MKKLTVFLLALSSAGTLCAQWFGMPTPGVPRTDDGRVDMTAAVPRGADGKVDLSGLWVPVDARGSFFEAANIQDWARDAMAAAESDFYRNDPRFACLPSGPSTLPAGASVGGMRRFVQHPDMLAELRYDMSYRQIFTDGRELEEEPLLPTWGGYSVGHWEGDTLVVDSNGYNDLTWLSREGLPHTEQLLISERYTRNDFGHLTLEVEYQDPGTFIRPVQATIDLEFRADTELLEIICNESATGQQHYSGSLEEAQEQVVEIPAATLENYVGTYQGIWLGNMITTEFLVEDGELVLIRSPRYSDTGGNTGSARYTLVALSQNAFDCSCGLGFVFHTDDSGKATEVDEVHVSGSWPFVRVD
ncbi:MAG TPA: hypothetical protein GX696_02690 [Pseudomonadaceae bacterium]|nr:hypothetical protein [Pseudomonadaceae bacterium]